MRFKKLLYKLNDYILIGKTIYDGFENKVAIVTKLRKDRKYPYLVKILNSSYVNTEFEFLLSEEEIDRKLTDDEIMVFNL